MARHKIRLYCWAHCLGHDLKINCNITRSSFGSKLI